MSFAAGVSASMAYASYLIKVGLISLGALGVTGILRNKSLGGSGGGYGTDYGGYGGGGYGRGEYGDSGSYRAGAGAYGNDDYPRGGAYGSRETGYGGGGYGGGYGGYGRNDWYRKESPDKPTTKNPLLPDDPTLSDDEYYEQYYKNYYDNYYKNYWDDYYKSIGESPPDPYERSSKEPYPESKRPTRYKRNLRPRRLSLRLNHVHKFRSTLVEEQILKQIRADDAERCGLRLVCELSGVSDRLLSRDEWEILRFISSGDALYNRVRPGQGIRPDSPVLREYQWAAHMGTHGADCALVFQSCPYNANQMMGLVEAAKYL